MYDGLSDFEKGLFGKLSDSEKADYAQSAKKYVPEPREDNLDKFLEEYEASLIKRVPAV